MLTRLSGAATTVAPVIVTVIDNSDLTHRSVIIRNLTTDHQIRLNHRLSIHDCFTLYGQGICDFYRTVQGSPACNFIAAAFSQRDGQGISLTVVCNFAFFSGLIDAQFRAGSAQPKSPELTANYH